MIVRLWRRGLWPRPRRPSLGFRKTNEEQRRRSSEDLAAKVAHLGPSSLERHKATTQEPERPAVGQDRASVEGHAEGEDEGHLSRLLGVSDVLARVDVRAQVVAGNAGELFGRQNVLWRQWPAEPHPIVHGRLIPTYQAAERRLRPSHFYGSKQCARFGRSGTVHSVRATDESVSSQPIRRNIFLPVFR